MACGQRLHAQPGQVVDQGLAFDQPAPRGRGLEGQHTVEALGQQHAGRAVAGAPVDE
jgi:hypothetical protein